jgi:predicted N-acetyltransferase YhbS
MDRGTTRSTSVVDIRPLDPADAAAVSSLVQRVFDEHVAGSFGPEGIAEMHSHTRPDAIADRAQTHATLVAWKGTTAVGVIEVRDARHITMLFVSTSHMGRGIASALMACAEVISCAAGCSEITVHSSLNAQSYYERQGFAPTSNAQQLHGFAFVPMKKQL